MRTEARSNSSIPSAVGLVHRPWRPVWWRRTSRLSSGAVSETNESPYLVWILGRERIVTLPTTEGLHSRKLPIAATLGDPDRPSLPDQGSPGCCGETNAFVSQRRPGGV